MAGEGGRGRKIGSSAADWFPRSYGGNALLLLLWGESGRNNTPGASTLCGPCSEWATWSPSPPPLPPARSERCQQRPDPKTGFPYPCPVSTVRTRAGAGVGALWPLGQVVVLRRAPGGPAGRLAVSHANEAEAEAETCTRPLYPSSPLL
ncbi:hypothetical protein ANANG_G00208500 [Anguilla anguilla]|uniref:Uncharacterized protein n=1 Tax=Anguilla anguilla TaxID=7936 RepID=A0A9D3RRR7_ANGAN|nr:hypothetical protein ANANG_G00208500 [Anguilla anguilla]